MTDTLNKNMKQINRTLLLIRMARVIVILSFFLFIPGAVVVSALNVSSNLIGVAFFFLFFVSSGFFMFARCPRCGKPVHYYPADGSNQYRENSRLSHPFMNFGCIHCGLLFSGVERDGGYTKADFLGVTAMPVYIRAKAVLKIVGATIVVGLSSIFLVNREFFETPIWLHLLVGIPSFLALVGFFEFFVGVQFKLFLKNIFIQVGKVRIVILMVVSTMICLAPFYSFIVLYYLRKLG